MFRCVCVLPSPRSYTRENRITEMVQPVMIPISILCQPDVTAPEGGSHPEVVVIVSDEVSDPNGDVMFCQSELHKLVWY